MNKLLKEQIERLKGMQIVCESDGSLRYPYTLWVWVQGEEGYHNLPIVLYYLNRCHSSLKANWICEVKTDCGMSEFNDIFQIHGTDKETSIDESIEIGTEIKKYIDEYKPTDDTLNPILKGEK